MSLIEEETEVKKDIEWLKIEVKKLEDKANKRNQFGSEYTDEEVALENVVLLLSQLDEPEALSQEWIDDHKVARINNLRKMTTDDVVSVKDLQNLLVPKQEEEQKYNVKFKVKSSSGTVGIFLYKRGDEVLAGDNFIAYYPKEDECRLTEQEIRDFQNGDVLFEHFAVKVEELEE